METISQFLFLLGKEKNLLEFLTVAGSMSEGFSIEFFFVERSYNFDSVGRSWFCQLF